MGDPARKAGSPKFGAEILSAQPLGDPLGAAVDEVASITPDLLNAQRDLDNDCHFAGSKVTQVEECAYGDPGSKPHILVLGDSHAQQWMPALKAIAEAEDWRVVAHAKVLCPFIQGQVGSDRGPYRSCTEWNRNVRRTLATEAEPDLVILTNRMFSMVENGRVLTGPANAAKVTDALRAAIREFTDVGVPVAVIRDTPLAKVNVPDCVGRQHRTAHSLRDTPLPGPAGIRAAGRRQGGRRGAPDRPE
jgi:hypothetical protein